MKNFKNYLIALLTGLLVLSLSTQQSQGVTATPSTSKTIEYDHCLTVYEANDATAFMNMERNITKCAKYKP